MSAPVLGTSPWVGDGLQVKGPPPRVPLRLATPPKAVGKHSPTPPRAQPPPAKKAKDEPLAEKEELVPMGDVVDWCPEDAQQPAMDNPEPASSSSEHARSRPEPSMEDPEHARSGLGASLRHKERGAKKEAAPTATPAADASMQAQEPARGGSEPAGGGSGSQQEVAPKAVPEATPAAAASLQHQYADEVIDVTDRRGWAVRHDTTGMVPYELTLFRDL